MKLKTLGRAGTLESSDILITVESTAGTGIELQLKSSVEKQYGRHIRKIIEETVHSFGLEHGVLVTAVDKGALDCVIQARVSCALYRAAGNASDTTAYRWEV